MNLSSSQSGHQVVSPVTHSHQSIIFCVRACTNEDALDLLAIGGEQRVEILQRVRILSLHIRLQYLSDVDYTGLDQANSKFQSNSINVCWLHRYLLSLVSSDGITIRILYGLAFRVCEFLVM